MKQFLNRATVLALLFLFLGTTAKARPKKLKIIASPADTQIFVDGNYMGDGVVEVSFDRTDFMAIRLEKEGYLTQEARVYKTMGYNETTVSYTMRIDKFYNESVPSGLVNKFFSVTVSPDYYTVDENGKKNPEKAWKLIHQILLNYCEELQITDYSSGFIQTPWSYDRYPESKQVVRTRVTVKQSGISDDNLVFQIKISSEQAPLVGMSNENSYQEVVRILKKYEPLIGEFKTRFSKK